MRNADASSTASDKFVCHNVVVRDGALLQIRNGAATLDSTDFKILEALQENAKQTYTAIGRRLGLAHSTVYDRIKAMEKYGIIKKYTVLVDHERTGPKKITAVMTVYTDPKESERVAERLSGDQRVVEVYTSLSEELLIIAKVVAENQESLHSFIADSVAPMPGVLRIRTSIITKKFKEEQTIMCNDPKKLTLKSETDNKTGGTKP